MPCGGGGLLECTHTRGGGRNMPGSQSKTRPCCLFTSVPPCSERGQARDLRTHKRCNRWVRGLTKQKALGAEEAYQEAQQGCSNDCC